MIPLQDIKFSNGDIVVSNGDICLCNDENEDIIQMANNNINLIYGDNIYHTDIGNAIYGQRIKANDTGLATVEFECKQAILRGDDRVSDIDTITAVLGDNASCIVSYVLILEDGSKIDGSTAIRVFNTDISTDEDEDYDEEEVDEDVS